MERSSYNLRRKNSFPWAGLPDQSPLTMSWLNDEWCNSYHLFYTDRYKLQIYLFILDLTRLSIAEVILSRMLKWSKYNEWGSIWKKWLWPNLRIHPSIFQHWGKQLNISVQPISLVSLTFTQTIKIFINIRLILYSHFNDNITNSSEANYVAIKRLKHRRFPPHVSQFTSCGHQYTMTTTTTTLTQ
jgi:hypothetical protein